MRIESKYKLESCVSNERASLHDILIENGKAIACDGKIIAIVPIELEEGDTAQKLNPEVLKKGRKLNKKRDVTIVLKNVNGTATLENGDTVVNQCSDENYPNYKAVFPPDENPVIQIALDVKLLHSLSEGLGSNRVLLTIYDNKHAIKVNPMDVSQYSNEVNTDIIGLIMPCKFKIEPKKEG